MALVQQPSVSGKVVVDGGRERMLGRKAVVGHVDPGTKQLRVVPRQPVIASRAARDVATAVQVEQYPVVFDHLGRDQGSVDATHLDLFHGDAGGSGMRGQHLDIVAPCAGPATRLAAQQRAERQ
ncbi:hypothetical protein D9M70_560120 [compost metagenome]